MGDYVTIVGATGKTGRRAVQEGLRRGWRVRAASRREPRDGEWERFEWDDRTTWAPAFRGSDAAYLLIPFNHPGAAETTPDLIQAAAHAGVRRIALLSSLDADHAAADDPLRVAEQALLDLPVTAAILRPTWFFDNFGDGSFAAMTREGELRLPAGEAKIPFIHVRDVAAAAVATLADGAPSGIFPLTGPEAIDHAQLAAALTEALGRPISYVPAERSEFIELMVGRGFGRDYADFLADALIDVAEGRLEIPVYDTVERLCGRPALDARAYARELASSEEHTTPPAPPSTR
jgi:uncharacterized protein YbjT (DUF2867 family)